MILQRNIIALRPASAVLNTTHPLFYGINCAYLFSRGVSVGVTSVIDEKNLFPGTPTTGIVYQPCYQIGGASARMEASGTDFISLSQPSVQAAGSISCWAMSIGGNTGEGVVFGSYGGSGNRRAPGLQFDGSNPALTFNYEFGATFGTTGPAWQAGRWYHLCCTWHQSDNTLKFFIDGVRWISTTWSDPGGAWNTTAHLGHYNGFGTQYLNGAIGPFISWTRAISDQDVYSLWHPLTRWNLINRPAKILRVQAQAAAASSRHLLLLGVGT